MGLGNYCDTAGATKLKRGMQFFLAFLNFNVQKFFIKEINEEKKSAKLFFSFILSPESKSQLWSGIWIQSLNRKTSKVKIKLKFDFQGKMVGKQAKEKINNKQMYFFKDAVS